MTLYAIFDPKPGKPALPAAIPETFSWLAAVLPPVFLIRHGLWLQLLAFVLALVGLGVVARFIGGDAAVLLYLLGALWLGFAAAGLRRTALKASGWRHRGDRVAPSADLAQLAALEARS